MRPVGDAGVQEHDRRAAAALVVGETTVRSTTGRAAPVR